MNTYYFFAPFPVLDTGDIILREITVEDAQDYLDYMSQDAMTGFLTKDNRPQNIESAVQEMQYWSSLFHSKRSIYWAIALSKSNKMIGTLGFNHISLANARAEISYDLNPEYWGQGIMLKSMKSVLKFADTVGIVRVQATVITDNERSIKVLERCGFTKEGFMKKYEVVEGEHEDYFMLARINQFQL